MSHLSQIVPNDSSSDKTFNSYVIPTEPGLPVDQSGSYPLWKKFLKWLQKFHKIISVAHNGRRFPCFIDSLEIFQKNISRQNLTISKI